MTRPNVSGPAPRRSTPPGVTRGSARRPTPPGSPAGAGHLTRRERIVFDLILAASSIGFFVAFYFGTR